MRRFEDNYCVTFSGDIDGISDDFTKRVLLDRLPSLGKVEFYRNEIKRQQEEMERCRSIIESCYGSLFDYVNDANERFGMISNYSIISKYDKEGLKGVKFNVEEVRRLFFDDEHCEKLKSYNCIAVSADEDPFSCGGSVCYHFFNGKTTFAVKIPCKAERLNLLCRLQGENRHDYDLYNYGKFGLSVIVDGEDETFFRTYDLLEFRKKLVEMAECDFEGAYTGKEHYINEDEEDVEPEDDEEEYC